MVAETRVRLWMVALAVLALVAAGVAWQVGRDHASGRAITAAAPSCADVRLVLVPGNAQGGAGDPGPVLTRFAQRFDAAVAGRLATEQIVVPDPAASVRVLGTRFPRRPADKIISSAQVRRWESGINVAASALLGTLARSVATCPNTALVLAGYSQGAGAVHRALTKIAHGTGLARRIIGTVLLGDPDRRQHTRALSAYRPAANGIEFDKRVQIGDVPSPRSQVTTYSLCLPADLVCAFGSQPIVTGIAAHNRYGSLPVRLYDEPSQAILNVALAIPRVSPGAPVANGMVGDQFHNTIPVRVAASAAPGVAFTAVSALPPGLQLTRGGLVAGLPLVAGTTVIRYRVQNTTSAKAGLPVSGALTVTIKPSAGMQVSAGGETTCVVRSDQSLYCWGANGYGQVGNGTRTDVHDPTRVGTGTWSAVATGGSHTCGVRTSTTLWCWGSNRYGQLGDGTTTDHLRPFQVGTSAGWRTVSVSNFNTCALNTASALYCWGNSIWGQVGSGTNTTTLRPRALGSGWTSVSSAAWSTCGTKIGGALYCWGANDFGQLGDGTRTSHNTPTRIAAGYDWIGVSIGSMHTCGLLVSGYLRCWGANTNGQLGDGNRTTSTRPMPVFGNAAWRAVSAGDLFTCGIKLDTSVWCWGSGSLGQRGSGVIASSPTPVRVSSNLLGGRIGAGWSHACAVDAGTLGTLSCWGFNNRGQLGDGTTSLRTQPGTKGLP